MSDHASQDHEYVPPFQLSTAHAQGPTVVDGPYELSDSGLAVYNNVPRNMMMSTMIELTGVGEHPVKDIAYDTGNGIGYRPIPVSDNSTVVGPDGSSVPGHEVIDDFIRRSAGLGPDDPIAAYIIYCHPEYWKSEGLEALMSSELATERKCTHMGIYVGNGKTLNSPETYHDNVWQTEGYPAHVIIPVLKGVKQNILNQSIHNKAAVTNNGVAFPSDYKNDPYKTRDLKTMLTFFRDWLWNADHLRQENNWKTYCAEHQSIALTLANNLPDNEEAFVKAYGDDGKALFAEYKKAIKDLTGEVLKETFYTPLYEIDEDFTVETDASSGEPVSVIRTADASVEGKAFPVPAQASAGLLANAIETYLPSYRVGGILTSSMIMGFKETADQRMGLMGPDRPDITTPLANVDDTFLNYALPVVNKINAADALTAGIRSEGDLKQFVAKRTAELFVGYGAEQELIPVVQSSLKADGTIDQGKLVAGLESAGLPPAELQKTAERIGTAWGLARASTAGIAKDAATILGFGLDPSKPQSRVTAYSWLRSEIAPILAAAHEQSVTQGKTARYWPPAILQRAIDDQVPKNPNVDFFVIGTAFDGSELQFRAQPGPIPADTRPQEAFAGVERKGSIGTPVT